MNSTEKIVGSSPLRKDAFEKVTGTATFIADIRLPGMLYAKILRSEHAHANILGIDTSEAEKAPGVVKVVTGKDCQDLYFGCCYKDQLPLMYKKVHHAGDAVAAVIADSERNAENALKQIRVEYEVLPHVTDALAAMKEDAPLIHEKNGEYFHVGGFFPKAGTNVYHHYKLRSGDAETAFEECDAVEEAEFAYPLNAHAAMEPHGCIAWWEGPDRVKIWSSTQGPFVVREEVAHMFGIPMANIEVFVHFLGGAFGSKSDLIIEPMVAYIARFVPGRPVRLILSRKEVFTSTVTGRGIQGKIKLGAKKDGTLHAIVSDMYFAAGAYADTGCNVVQAAGYVGTGPYEIKNCSVNAVGVYTNTPPIGAFRGYGHPEAHIMIEKMVDVIARKLNMNPSEVRKKNFLSEGKENCLGQTIIKGNGDLGACLKNVERALFETAKPASDGEYLYGRGVAALMKTPMMAATASSGAVVKFGDDGSVNVNISGTEMGQGLHTVIAQIAAEILKIPIEKVFVSKLIDTQYSPQEWQTVASISTYRVGNAVAKGCYDAVEKILKNASAVLQQPLDNLIYEGAQVRCKNNPAISVPLKRLTIGTTNGKGNPLGEPVIGIGFHLCRGIEFPDPETGRGNAAPQWTYGCQGAEIKVHRKTGKVTVSNLVCCIDAGKVINPKLAAIQMMGGMTMGMGAALSEEILFDEQGKIKNPNFNTYRIPGFEDRPEKFSISFVETPQEDGPFGARCIAEHPAVAIPPAILNAFYDASGKDVFSIPLTPEKVLNALEGGDR